MALSKDKVDSGDKKRIVDCGFIEGRERGGEIEGAGELSRIEPS